MQLIVLGLNHKTAPVEVREKFNFSRSRIKHILRLFRESDDFSEAVLVSTCNRTELYLVAQEPEDGMAALHEAVKRIAGKDWQKISWENAQNLLAIPSHKKKKKK